jgi:hypothetical protein
MRRAFIALPHGEEVSLRSLAPYFRVRLSGAVEVMRLGEEHVFP